MRNAESKNSSEHKNDEFLTVNAGRSLLSSHAVALVDEGCEERVESSRKKHLQHILQVPSSIKKRDDFSKDSTNSLESKKH